MLDPQPRKNRWSHAFFGFPFLSPKLLVALKREELARCRTLEVLSSFVSLGPFWPVGFSCIGFLHVSPENSAKLHSQPTIVSTTASWAPHLSEESPSFYHQSNFINSNITSYALVGSDVLFCSLNLFISRRWKWVKLKFNWSLYSLCCISVCKLHWFPSVTFIVNA